MNKTVNDIDIVIISDSSEKRLENCLQEIDVVSRKLMEKEIGINSKTVSIKQCPRLFTSLIGTCSSRYILFWDVNQVFTEVILQSLLSAIQDKDDDDGCLGFGSFAPNSVMGIAMCHSDLFFSLPYDRFEFSDHNPLVPTCGFLVKRTLHDLTCIENNNYFIKSPETILLQLRSLLVSENKSIAFTNTKNGSYCHEETLLITLKKLFLRGRMEATLIQKYPTNSYVDLPTPLAVLTLIFVGVVCGYILVNMPLYTFFVSCACYSIFISLIEFFRSRKNGVLAYWCHFAVDIGKFYQGTVDLSPSALLCRFSFAPKQRTKIWDRSVSIMWAVWFTVLLSSLLFGLVAL